MMPSEKSSIARNFVDCRILIVDDEPLIIEATKIQLCEAGFRDVIGISDSMSAVERIHNERPDVILMDLSMPDIGGNYLIQVVRQDPAIKNVPIIVITAETDPKTRQRAMELGADAILAKPVDSNSLLTLLAVMLDKRQRDSLAEVQQRERQLDEIQSTDQQLRLLAGRS